MGTGQVKFCCSGRPKECQGGAEPLYRRGWRTQDPLVSTSDDRASGHWDRVYQEKSDDAVSWFQPKPTISLPWVDALPSVEAAIDVGAGASRFVDEMLQRHVTMTALDLADEGLAVSRERLGARASEVEWLVGDVTRIALPQGHFDLWHDRAVFHFLTTAKERANYVGQLRDALKVGGHVIMATFGPDGPERCSGLPIVRYTPAALQMVLGEGFHLLEEATEMHPTPWGGVQSFVYALFHRVE